LASREAIQSERLDAPFYDPGHNSLDAILRRHGAVDLSSVATLIETRWAKSGSDFAYFEIGELDIASGVLSPSRLAVSLAPSRAQIRVEPWDVLVSTVRPNRKNIGLVPVADDGLPLVASTGFAVLRFSTPESAVFYHAFLRSDAATQQLMRWNSGATYPAIENDVPLRLLVPHFEDNVVQLYGARWLEKYHALDASQRLTLAAKLLVESLIDGRLSEADLVAAQKSLELGDRSDDRALLRDLRNGKDPTGPVLFKDLDHLFGLLDAEDHRAGDD
jgi:type I restriction enzyme S subunit